MHILIHPTYFPSIAHFAAIVQSEFVTFEVADNYQKQTYRNRAYIYGANGKLSLNVPVIFSQKNRQLYKDVKIANKEKWQELNWKSIQSSYRSSPFFEFYEDELKPLFQKKHEFILDLNFECFNVINECLQFNCSYSQTTEFKKEISGYSDLRYLVNARKELKFNFDNYTQVFSNKHGFISNLSILDLLFNEGPNALNYLVSQKSITK